MNTTLEQALRDFVVSATGLQNVIFDGQNGPRPALPFAVISFIAAQPLGRSIESQNQINYKHKSETVHKLTVNIQIASLNAVGSNSAMALASNLYSARWIPKISDALRAANIGITDVGTVRLVPTIEFDSVNAPRATLDLVLYTVLSFEDPNDTGSVIEHVTGTGTLTEPDHELIIDADVSVGGS